MPYDAQGPVADAAGVRREGRRRRPARRTSTSRCGRPCRPAGRSSTSRELVDAGAAAFKLSTFETHPERFPRIPDDQLLRRSPRSRAAGGMAGVHAENDEIVRAGIAAERAAGHGGDPLAHARSRPPVAEHEAIARCLELARATGVRLHVCHVSTPRGVELVARGARRRRRRQRRELPALPAARRVRARPARRRGEDQPAAARARAGRSTASTSSPPTTSAGRAERKRGDDIFALASGCPGVELIVPLVHDAFGAEVARADAVRGARARASGCGRARARLRRAPTRTCSCSIRDAEWEIDPAALVTPAGWSPYRGRRLRGRVIAAFSRGVQVWDGARVCAPAGHGRHVRGDGGHARGSGVSALRCPQLAQRGDPAPAREQPRDRRAPRGPRRLRGAREGWPATTTASRGSCAR